MVDFTGRLINGSLRYRTSDELQSTFSTPPPRNSRKRDKDSDECSTTWASRLKQLPCYLQLPPISLPARLDAVAIDYLREHSLSSPKAIEDRSKILTNYLWSRPLMSEVSSYYYSFVHVMNMFLRRLILRRLFFESKL